MFIYLRKEVIFMEKKTTYEELVELMHRVTPEDLKKLIEYARALKDSQNPSISVDLPPEEHE